MLIIRDLPPRFCRNENGSVEEKGLRQEAGKAERKERSSNFEAMRVVSMLLVLMVHSLFFSNGKPTPELIQAHPFSSLAYTFFEALAIVCVNCFVLISGYFGIKPSKKGVLKLIFTIFFYKIIILASALAFSPEHYGIKTIILNLLPNSNEWFVWAYLGLMLLAPLMNAFISHTDKKSFATFLLLFFGIEFASCFIYTGVFEFKHGYSAISFVGLYMLARFYKIHIENNSKISSKSGVILYLITSLLSTLQFIACHTFLHIKYLRETSSELLLGYSSPFAVIAALGVLVFFSKIRLRSKFINWLGASALAIYLIHLNPYIVGYYKAFSRNIYSEFWPWAWLPVALIFICTVYLICAIIDQCRLWIWNKLLKSSKLFTKTYML